MSDTGLRDVWLAFAAFIMGGVSAAWALLNFMDGRGYLLGAAAGLVLMCAGLFLAAVRARH